MTLYNLTGIAQNSTSMLSYVQGVNDVLMLGWLGTLMLIGISVVIYTSYAYVTKDGVKSLAVTAFISLTLAMILRAVSLISGRTLFITAIIAAGTIAFIWNTNR